MLRPLAWMFGLGLLWWLLPAVFASFLRSSFFEFQAPAWTALSYLGDLQDYWCYRWQPRDRLIEAGRDLARLNAGYRLRLQEMESLRRENERLERLLALPAEPQYRYEVARVILRDQSSWWSHFFIRKGRSSGLRPGQAVVWGGGVVGRVREVHAYTAVVELATSPSFRMAAHLAGDPRPVIYQGGQGHPGALSTGQASHLPLDVKPGPDAPLWLVSSRLGGVFPDGLTIGRLQKLAPTPDGLFLSAEVLLDPRLGELREVAVLVPESAP